MIELGARVAAYSDTERCRDVSFIFKRRWVVLLLFTLVTQGAVLGAPVASLQA